MRYRDTLSKVFAESLLKDRWNALPLTLALYFTARAEENDDTVTVSILPSNQLTMDEDVSGGEPWREFIGRSFGWGWLIMNQQGYIDGLLIGFDGIEPAVLLNVLASSIKISRIVRVSP